MPTTVTAQNTDANRAASDQGTLTFQMEVYPRSSVAPNPTPLTEANLNGATHAVTLPSGFAFAASLRRASRSSPAPRLRASPSATSPAARPARGTPR